jgi:hypothetical protein
MCLFGEVSFNNPPTSISCVLLTGDTVRVAPYSGGTNEGTESDLTVTGTVAGTVLVVIEGRLTLIL